jgi:hypothetical protein
MLLVWLRIPVSKPRFPIRASQIGNDSRVPGPRLTALVIFLPKSVMLNSWRGSIADLSISGDALACNITDKRMAEDALQNSPLSLPSFIGGPAANGNLPCRIDPPRGGFFQHTAGINGTGKESHYN